MGDQQYRRHMTTCLRCRTLGLKIHIFAKFVAATCMLVSGSSCFWFCPAPSHDGDIRLCSHLNHTTQKKWEHVPRVLLDRETTQQKSPMVTRCRSLEAIEFASEIRVSVVVHDRGGLTILDDSVCTNCSLFSARGICSLACDGDLSHSRAHKLSREQASVFSSHLLFDCQRSHPTWLAEHCIQTLMKRKVWRRTSCANIFIEMLNMIKTNMRFARSELQWDRLATSLNKCLRAR